MLTSYVLSEPLCSSRLIIMVILDVANYGLRNKQFNDVPNKKDHLGKMFNYFQ